MALAPASQSERAWMGTAGRCFASISKSVCERFSYGQDVVVTDRILDTQQDIARITAKQINIKALIITGSGIVLDIVIRSVWYFV